MKRRIGYFVIFAILIGLFLAIPAYAMEGTDGTVDTPTNRNADEVTPEPIDFDLETGEIETGEGYENITPITDDNLFDEEDEDDEDLLPLILLVSGATVAVVGALAFYLIRKKN